MEIDLNKLSKFMIFSAVLSISITAITGLIPNQPDASIIGADYYGFPKPWLVKIPLQQETNFIATNFVLDLLIFFILSALLLIIVSWQRARIGKNRGLKLLTLFSLSAFLTKIVAEFVHEVLGHGLFVLLFGGKITEINISLLWPYEFSSIGWSGSFTSCQLPWIHGGGILICLIFTGILQAVLVLKVVKNWQLASVLFWLSFWTLLNATGYLILGGISPFGDVSDLISDGVLTKQISLFIGLSIFLTAFFSLSRIFSGIVYRTGIAINKTKIRLYLVLFWLLIFPLTLVAVIGRGWPIVYLPMGFLPAIATLFIPIKILAKHGSKLESGESESYEQVAPFR